MSRSRYKAVPSILCSACYSVTPAEPAPCPTCSGQPIRRGKKLYCPRCQTSYPAGYAPCTKCGSNLIRRFASKAEATNALFVEGLVGDTRYGITAVTHQPRFPMPPGITYVADFELHGPDILIDIKGTLAQGFAEKMRLFAYFNPEDHKRLYLCKNAQDILLALRGERTMKLPGLK